MRVLYVANPLSRWNVQVETSPLMVREARRRGAETFLCTIADLGFDGPRPVAQASEIAPDGSGFSAGPPTRIELRDLDVIHLRTNPPFDLSYYYATLVLEAAAERAVVVNNPTSVRALNEKLSILRFPDLICETMVSASVNEVVAFVDAVGGRAVLKPLYRCSGQGVRLLEGGAAGVRRRVEEHFAEDRDPVMVQRFIPEVVDEGETRLTVIGGRVAGWMRKRPAAGGFLANLDFGASVEACPYTEKEERIMAQVGPLLRESGIYLAAVDTIDGFLTEINVTSPGLLHEMNEVNGSALERELEDLVQELVKQRS